MPRYELTQRRKAQKDQTRRWDLPTGSHVWCYLRHSPGDNQTIDSQVQGMQTWCAENGWIIDRFWTDEAVEGSREDREQFQQMVALARQVHKHVDGIAVWSFSRFARDQLDAQFYKAELRKKGYVIVSKIDDVPAGEMAPIYEAFIDWKNQRFLEDLSADVKRGQAFIVEQGFWPGGKPAVGYRAEKIEIGIRRNGSPRYGLKLVKDESVADRIALAWKLKLEGNVSLLEIHEATHLYSKREHYSEFFGNLLYAGIFNYRGQRFPKAWEEGQTFCDPYITLDSFLTVQKKREARTRTSVAPRRLSSPYLLTGLLRCGLCSERGLDVPMNGYYKKQFQNSRMYRCATKMHGRGADCAMPRTPTWMVDDAICTDVLERVLTTEFLYAAVQATQEELAGSGSAITQRIIIGEEELREQRERLAHLVTAIERKGLNDIIEQQYDRVNQRYTELTVMLANLRAQQKQTRQKVVGKAEIERFVAEMSTALLDGPVEERRAVLAHFIDRVVLNLDHVVIQYKFRDEAGGGGFMHIVPAEQIGGLCFDTPWGHPIFKHVS